MSLYKKPILSENATKLTYGNVDFQNWSREDPRTPRFKRRGGEWREGGRERRGDEEEGGKERRDRGQGNCLYKC
jgi:hypothetical protein